MNANGRPTTDNKKSTLKLRLNDEMRDWIEKQSNKIGISMSAYIRDLIERDMRI